MKRITLTHRSANRISPFSRTNRRMRYVVVVVIGQLERAGAGGADRRLNKVFWNSLSKLELAGKSSRRRWFATDTLWLAGANSNLVLPNKIIRTKFNLKAKIIVWGKAALRKINARAPFKLDSSFAKV
jgi:hypothetical protein